MWIKCSERLPQVDGIYLVTAIGYEPFVGNFHINKIDDSHWIFDGFAVTPTHWQNLPEPPKE